MTYEFLAAQKATGNTLNLTNSITQVVWSTQRTGQPGKLTFTYLRTPESKLEEGDVIRFSVNGQLQFYGWVFTRGFDRWGPVDVVCYDRIRYLKANASYSFYGQSAGDIIRQIAEGGFGNDVFQLIAIITRVVQTQGAVEQRGFATHHLQLRQCFIKATRLADLLTINRSDLIRADDECIGMTLRNVARFFQRQTQRGFRWGFACFRCFIDFRTDDGER